METAQAVATRRISRERIMESTLEQHNPKKEKRSPKKPKEHPGVFLAPGERVIPFQLISPDDEQIGIVVTRRKTPMRELGTFTMISRSYLRRLLKDGSFAPGGTVFAVLLLIVAKVDYTNTWVASSDDIASRVGCTDRSVRDAIKVLRTHGIIAKLPAANAKGASGHMLNPFFAARGKSHSVRELQQKWIELHRKSVQAADAA